MEIRSVSNSDLPNLAASAAFVNMQQSNSRENLCGEGRQDYTRVFEQESEHEFLGFESDESENNFMLEEENLKRIIPLKQDIISQKEIGPDKNENIGDVLKKLFFGKIEIGLGHNSRFKVDDFIDVSVGLFAGNSISLEDGEIKVSKAQVKANFVAILKLAHIIDASSSYSFGVEIDENLKAEPIIFEQSDLKLKENDINTILDDSSRISTTFNIDALLFACIDVGMDLDQIDESTKFIIENWDKLQLSTRRSIHRAIKDIFDNQSKPD